MATSQDLLAWIGEEVARFEGTNVPINETEPDAIRPVPMTEATDLHARFTAWAHRVHAPWFTPDLMMSMLVQNVQQSFGIAIADEELAGLRTCGELVTLIQGRMKQA